MKIEVKTDCQYLTDKAGVKDCRVLKELVCRYKNCTFYKPDPQKQLQEAEEIEEE